MLIALKPQKYIAAVLFIYSLNDDNNKRETATMVQGKFVSLMVVVTIAILLQLVSADDCEFQTKHFAISGFVGFGAVLGT